MCSQETDLHLKHVITLFPHSVLCFSVTSACTKLPYCSASKPPTTVSPLHLNRPPASKFRSSPGHPFFVLRISSAQCHGHFSLETNTSVVLIISPYPSSFGSIRPPTPKHRSSSKATVYPRSFPSSLACLVDARSPETDTSGFLLVSLHLPCRASPSPVALTLNT